MTDVTVGRLSATIHAMPGTIPGLDDPRGRVDRMLRHLADHRLDQHLARLGLPEGDWCVRRLELALALTPDDHDATIESAWADAVLESLARTLDTSTGDVVHYRRRQQALEDLVVSVASGRTERAWAWRQLGVLAPSDPSPDVDPGSAIVAALERSPDQALQAIVAASRTVGAAALHRVLGTGGWVRLASVVARAAGAPRALPTTEPAPAGQRTPETPGIEVKAEQALRDSSLGAALMRTGLRPSPCAAASWAVLAVAESDPGALRNSAAEALVSRVTRAFSTAQGGTLKGLRTGPAGETRRTGSERPPPSGDELQPERRPHGDELPDAAETQTADARKPGRQEPSGAMTPWGGLLFLLATAEAAGVPDALMEDPRLELRPVRWVLQQLALLLVPIGGEDPAAHAFAGLPPDAGLPAWAPPTAAEVSTLAEGADRWAGATAQRLGRSEADPSEVVLEVARRRGEIVAEPGWIEVHLSLDDVDIDIRRAGLDLDPGWVPWLGVVVRFVYG